MNDTIELGGRYGYNHKLKHIGGNYWRIELDPKSTGTYRVIGYEGDYQIGKNCKAFDPEGGPFLSVGSKIGDKTIKSIYTDGVFELE